MSELDCGSQIKFNINSQVVVTRLIPNVAPNITRVDQVEDRVIRDLRQISLRGPEGLIYRFLRLVDPKQITDDRIKRRWPTLFQSSRRGNKYNILVAGKNYSNEGHFIFQHLPRLLNVLSVIGDCRPEDVTLLVNPGQQLSTVRWLDFYGLPRFGVAAVDEKSALRDLWYCPMPRNELSILSKEDIALFDAQCKYFSSGQEVQKNDLFDVPTFVLRGQKAKRRLLNEFDILNAISSFYGGVKVVDFSSDSSDDILQTFQRSSLIIGASGMGFSPAILARHADIAVIGNKFSTINWHLRYASIASMRGNIGFTLNCSLDPSVPFHSDFIFPENVFIAQVVQMERLRERR